jgi:hypothetical protein
MSFQVREVVEEVSTFPRIGWCVYIADSDRYVVDKKISLEDSALGCKPVVGSGDGFREKSSCVVPPNDLSSPVFFPGIVVLWYLLCSFQG